MSARSHKIVRDLLGNPARTILVVTAIAIGLAGLSTTVRARSIFTANLAQEIALVNPSSATILTENADSSAVVAVSNLGEVSEAVGRLVTFARITVGDEQRPLRLVVLDDPSATSVDRLRHESGTWPLPAGTIALERSSMDGAGLQIGDAAAVTDASGANHDLEVAATVHDLTIVSGKLVDQVVFGYTSTATWNQLGLPRGFNEIVITVTGDRTDTEYIGEVTDLAAQEIADNGFGVVGTRIPTPGKHVLDNVVSSLLLILGSLGVLSLVLSGFLVFNTVSAMLARQRPQIGVMKAVGGSRRDVLTLYLATVLIFSTLALVVAVPLGALAARILTVQLGSLLNIDIENFAVPSWVWFTELAIGLGVPVIAALGPILSGTRATVAEAIRGGDASDSFGPSRIDRALVRLQALPESLRYAARNTFRRKLRLTLTVIALSLGGAIVVTVMSLRGSLLATVDSIAAYWQQDVTLDLQTPLPLSDLVRAIGSNDDIDVVEGWMIVPSSIVGSGGREAAEETIVFGVPPDSEFIEPTMVKGRWLAQGDDTAVVINVDVAANEPTIELGHDVTLRILGVDSVWNVVGISTTQLVAPGEPRPTAPIAYVPIRSISASTGSAGTVNRLAVSGSAHSAVAQRDLRNTLDADLNAAGVEVRATETRSRMRSQVERLTTPILVLLTSMAILFGVVGGLGLLGTMSLNVLERTSEFGILRAIGATGRVVLSIVLVEGLTVAALSWLLGTVLAVPLGWAMASAVGISFIKVPLDFSFAPIGVVLWLVMVIVLAVVASWIPARKASRVSVRDAIAYE